MKQKVKRLVQIKSEKDIKMNAKLTATFIGEPLNSFRDINNNELWTNITGNGLDEIFNR